MKKLLIVTMALCLLASYTASPQGILKKVKSAVSKQITGNNNSGNNNNMANAKPDPKCACNDAIMLLDLGGTLQLTYNEISVLLLGGDSLLVHDRISNKDYILQDGKLEGPYPENDPKIENLKAAASGSEASEDDSRKADYWMNRYPHFISKSGEKYLIKFGGKSYGPYATINDFAVPKSRGQFAALVTENVVVSESDGKKMEAAMKNAKTDQERMDLAMKYSQQMSKQMMNNGGAESIMPKLVTSVTGAKYDQMAWMGAKLNGNVKYDEILVVSQTKVISLPGKTLFTFSNYEDSNIPIFISSDNSKYARYNFGSIVLSDNTTLPDLFNPHLIKTDGNVYLTYMYYSPMKNAIMQCKIPF